jgi:hypothetical protein
MHGTESLKFNIFTRYILHWTKIPWFYHLTKFNLRRLSVYFTILLLQSLSNWNITYTTLFSRIHHLWFALGLWDQALNTYSYNKGNISCSSAYFYLLGCALARNLRLCYGSKEIFSGFYLLFFFSCNFYSFLSYLNKTARTVEEVVPYWHLYSALIEYKWPTTVICFKRFSFLDKEKITLNCKVFVRANFTF